MTVDKACRLGYTWRSAALYVREPTGSNPGSKLSATEPNSEQLRPLQSAESQRVRLDPSGWGPGGRRFKSCLPDAKCLQSVDYLAAVQRAGLMPGA